MQNIYEEIASLDKRCYDKFGLTEDILMEHAANGISSYIHNNFAKNSKIIIVCGSGNNGADGLALARLLHVDYKVSIYYAKKVKSPMAILQDKRAKNIQVPECSKITSCDILVDAIVGTGFSGTLNDKFKKLISKMNNTKAFKIACDIPSAYIFKADITLTMGALKKSMFLDNAKDFIGEVKVLNLGISRKIYEKESNYKLLDLEDLELPYRNKKDSHKGTYGHLAIALGDKSGASIISALAAFKFGAGLVSLVGYRESHIPHTIMASPSVPNTTTALALGMGLVNEFNEIEIGNFLNHNLPLIADADVFSNKIILDILKRKNLVITPHPKEFISLLKLTNLANISIKELQKNRFKYVEIFCKKFKNVVLLLKGANVIIAQNNKLFINPHGSEILAKGGSGDILSGLIGSLLAQSHEPLSAAINASLTHTKLALNYKGASFSLTPDDLISQIGKL